MGRGCVKERGPGWWGGGWSGEGGQNQQMMQCQQEDGTDDRWTCLLVSTMIKILQIIQIKIIPCNFCQGAFWHKIRRKPLRNRRKDKLAVKELFYEIQVDEGIL